MFLKNIQLSLRHVLTHKIASALQIAGMATGLCVFYFAMAYVTFETSYDKFNEHHDRIYRLVTDVATPTGVNHESAAASMGPALQKEFPEVESATRIYFDDYIFMVDGKNHGTVPVAYADTTLFDVFSIPLVSGNPKMAFAAPFNMVISESASQTYFGSKNAIGKIVHLNGNLPAVVTGVMKDMPYNSHIRRDVFLSMGTLLDSTRTYFNTDWNRYGFYTYLLLKENANPRKLSESFPSFIKRHNTNSAHRQTLHLEPLKDVYLKGKSRGNRAGSTLHGNPVNVNIFTGVAILVLIIACFNFINLTTAFSVSRTSEISVRKIIGATKLQLITQFLTDAVVLSTIAFIFAILISAFALPYFNSLNGKIISDSIFDQSELIMWLGLISISAGLLSGIYPAMLLSSFKPVKTISAKFTKGMSGAALRKTLIVLQFSISIILIAITIVSWNQLDFMRNKDLGFKKDHLLVIDFQYDDRIRDHPESVKQQLLQIPGVTEASFSAYIPGKANRKYPITIVNALGIEEDFESDFYFVDDNFFNQYGISLVAGRSFYSNRSSDNEAMIVNATLAKSMGYNDVRKILGKKLTQQFAKGAYSGIIVGVVNDFHYKSYQEEIKPLVLRTSPSSFTYLSLKLSTDNLSGTLTQIEKTWAKMAEGLPFSYFFSDEVYDAQYKADERFGRIFICFSSLAIVISCLGLLGLSIHATSMRTKEMGIRRVLGASIVSLTRLLTQEFMLLIVIALIIAIPVAWVAINSWLENFAYRVSINYQIFIGSGMIVLIVAFLTTSVHAVRCAMTNPAESLKTE